MERRALPCVSVLSPRDAAPGPSQLGTGAASRFQRLEAAG